MSTARDEAEKAWNNYYTENFLEVEKWAYIKGFEDAWNKREETLIAVQCSCGAESVLRWPRGGKVTCIDPSWTYHSDEDELTTRLWNCGKEGHFQSRIMALPGKPEPQPTPIRDWYESRGLKVPPDAGK